MPTREQQRSEPRSDPLETRIDFDWARGLVKVAQRGQFDISYKEVLIPFQALDAIYHQKLGVQLASQGVRMHPATPAVSETPAVPDTTKSLGSASDTGAAPPSVPSSGVTLASRAG